MYVNGGLRLTLPPLTVSSVADTENVCENTGYPPWLLYLCIAFGLMFLIMLIINIFLCSAMTCACARTEIIEKEPSIIEDYDPYRSWHGSQYGSRYDFSNPNFSRRPIAISIPPPR